MYKSRRSHTRLIFKRNSKLFKFLTVFTLINYLTTLIVPTSLFGLTSGPSSPEFSTFEPVASTDMVNIFSGDFNYNLPVIDIPGPDGAGYALSLSYHSGSSIEQEASWVGFGWTLNPGAINRNTRGFPDDFNGDRVKRYNKTIPNWSASICESIGNLEIFGTDIPISASTSLRVNNYQGINRSYGLGLNFKGIVSLNMNIDAEGPTFSASVNPMGILNQLSHATDENSNSEAKKNDEKTEKDNDERIQIKWGDVRNTSTYSSIGRVSTYGLFSHSEVVRATSFSEYSGSSFNLTLFSIQLNLSQVPIGGEASFQTNINFQKNNEENNYNAYGFIHGRNLNDYGNSTLGDFYIERNAPFSKRDYTLGIPFNNADNFTTTGENLIGGFRYYPIETGHYYPNFSESKTSIFSAGIEFMLGVNLGIGLDFGFGNQKFESKDWSYSDRTGQRDPSNDKYQFNNAQGFFRFNNDLGGKIEYSNNTGIDVASISMETSFPGAKKAKPVISDDIIPELPDKGRASFIDYHTFEQVSEPSYRFNKTVNIDQIQNHIDSHDEENNSKNYSDAIFEFSITNEEGNLSIYGLPVFNRNEANLQFNVRPDARLKCSNSVGSPCILDNYIVYQNTNYKNNLEPNIETNSNKIVLGETKQKPYAGTYLLTQVFSHNYVDVNDNGPDDMDYGAWTNFHYHNAYGGDNNSWYKWRTPYSGMLYQKNQISDTEDDLAAVMFGEKEVYYLKAIETKTHVAFFVTNETTIDRFDGFIPDDEETRNHLTTYLSGSNTDRYDGLGAPKISTGGGSDPAANSMDAKGHNQKLEYLECIVLFSKSRWNKPVKTTRFQYDYSIAPNLPNNSNGQFPSNIIQDNSGKLTLKKVWFEYEGLARTRVSPYIFKYNYKQRSTYPSDLQENTDPIIQDIMNYENQYDRDADNPPYGPHLLDGWGYNQPLGEERQEQMKPWTYQGDISQYTEYDPAAWQLKQIILPSGGTIMIQYEQKVYSYVQDRDVMGMVSLLNHPSNESDFYLNLRDIGINPADYDMVLELKNKIEDYFGNTGENEKIYFKFLYHFKNESASLDNAMSEYISGYALFESASIENVGLEYRLKVKLKAENMGEEGRTTLPHQACYDYYINLRQGFETRNVKPQPGINQTVNESFIPDYSDRTDDIIEGLEFLDALGIATDLIIDFHDFIGHNIPLKGSVCQTLNPELSYLKIPMITEKRGGGMRVKRLLLYDPGIESGDAAIFGNTYNYVNSDGTSSGVATNEPTSNREENPLVTFLPRKEQGWFSRLTAGLDKKQTEGPIGESILPSPSVGYARVEIQNINSGQTGSGLTVHEFFTVKDYPFDKYYSTDDIEPGKGVAFSSLAKNTEDDFMLLPLGLFNYSVNKTWMTQGYRFILNNMHGQPKRISTYGFGPTNIPYVSSVEEFEYYEPGEMVKIVQPDGSYTSDTPGKEMDLTMEMKAVENNTFDIAFEVDISIGLSWIPPIFITVMPSVSIDNSGINTHVTSKVIRYPALLKGKSIYRDGTFWEEKYLAFSPYTGKPLLIRSFDGYHNNHIGSEKWDGSFYKLRIPAAFIYEEMGPKYIDNDHNSNQLNAITGSFTTYGRDGFPLKHPDAIEDWNLTNVISAQVQTYSKANLTSSWLDATIINDYEIDNELLFHNFWYPHSTYAYKTEVSSANSSSDSKVYNAGLYNDYNMFDYTNVDENLNNGWIMLNQTTKYSPNGKPLEEKDVLGNYHAIKYNKGYKYSVPIIRADNANYNSLYYEDFENDQQSTKMFAHSGKQSLMLSKEELVLGIEIVKNVYNTYQLKNENGGRFMCWIKLANELDAQKLIIRIGETEELTPLNWIAHVGDWTLFYSDIKTTDLASIALNESLQLTLLSTEEFSENIYVDDVRFQPFESQASCFVYDQETLRLISQFDDQHFGIYYQYNEEGQLIRKIIETENGLRTIQETQYNIPKIQK